MSPDTGLVSLAAFLVEVLRRAPHNESLVSEAELREPLAALTTRIHASPDTLENRVLTKLLFCVSDDSGTTMIRLSEVAAFSPAVLLLLSALVNDYQSGRYDRAKISSSLADQDVSTLPGT